MTNPEGYHWLSEEEYKKIKYRTDAHISAILKPLRSYGQSELVDGCINAIMDVVEQSWQIVRGKDKPLVMPTKYRFYNNDTYNADD